MSGPTGSAPGGPVLGVVVAYGPGPELADCLRAALPQVDALLLWENSDGPPGSRAIVEGLRSAEPTLPWDRLSSAGLGHNVGLSVAYQRGLELARREGHRFVLLLDQDSILDADAVSHLRQVHGRLSERFRVGAVNAQNREQVRLGLSPKPALHRLVQGRYEAAYRHGTLYRDATALERRTLINSGLLLSVDAALEVGGYDERLFLDAVDYDLALRLRAAGYRLFEAPGAGVAHQQGVPTPLGGPARRILVRGYPPRRSYHLVHDTMVVGLRRWRTDRGTAGAIVLSMWIGTFGAVLLLPERAARLRSIVAGMADVGPSLRPSALAGVTARPPGR